MHCIILGWDCCLQFAVLRLFSCLASVLLLCAASLLPTAACIHRSCRLLPSSFRLSVICDASVSVHVWFRAEHFGSVLCSCFRACDRVGAGLG